MNTPLDKLSHFVKKDYDLFIASSSYENRCLSIYNELETHVKFDDKIVCSSVPHKSIIKKNLEIFIARGFTVVDIDNSDQVKTMSNLLIPICKTFLNNPDASFLIDITTFTRQTLLILLRLLRNNLTSSNDIQFIYAPAKEYSIGLAYKEKWLTKGILAVNSVFGYSGIIRPSRPYHLIILLGFEVERASSLIDSYEPSKITIGYAKESDSLTSEDYKLNREKFEELLSEYPAAESFEFSCGDVEECKIDILQQVTRYERYNTIISPMNNKISTVACALATFDIEDIQLAIAIPATYNHENYSSPGDTFNMLNVRNFTK